MRKPTLALAVFGYLAGTSGVAAAPDTWVSGTGVDAGNCAVTAPCRTFQYALKRTRDNGIIGVASSGSFAGVTINKPVTIAADGVVAILRTPANCGAVVCVNIANGSATLRGLVIDPMRSGPDGIRVLSASIFHLKQSIVRQSGIGLLAKAPGGAYSGKIEVSNSILTGNDLAIRILAIQESRVSFDRVRVLDNRNGISFDNSARAGTISASVTDSVIAGHTGGYGIRAVTTPPALSGIYPDVSVTLDRTAVLNNRRGIVADGAAARVRLGNSTVTGNTIALRSLNSGVIPSYGTNKIDGNGAGEAPTLVIPQQ